MMILKDIKDWLKTQALADVWKVGTHDISKDKAVCACNLASNRSMLAVGGLQDTTTAIKGISIVVYWNRNPDETERVAQGICAFFYGQQPKIGDYRVIRCDMRSGEPISVGANTNGIYGYVIETRLTYERKE